MDPAAILIVASVLIMFLTLIGMSYKTGFAAFSIWSLTRKDQPKFKIKKEGIGKFLSLTASVLVLNIIFGIVIMRDLSQIVGILVLSLFNTLIIGYGLSFWVLLEEKKKD